MSFAAKARRAPLRAVTGAFIINSGVGKLGADDDTAKAMHGMATGTYPFLDKVQPKLFAKGLAVGEIAVGSVVLLPIVSPVVAGAALVGFSGALLNLYWNTPGMHEEGTPRPTQQGIPIAKDAWMLGIGLGLIADGVLEPAHDKKIELGAAVSERRAERSRRARRKANKAAVKTAAEAKAANSEFVKQARAAAKELQADAAKRAKKAAKKTQKRAAKASKGAADRLAEVRDEYGPVAAGKAKQAREAARGLADEYGPVAAEKAKQARDAARELVDEYGPVAAEKAKQARQAAQDAGAKARERVAG
jgi:uncharacterized membrane protein YphA (DoxX/SURF4 family)